ncbi:hypothetical protein [Haloarchaeobius sp. HME9146]|uniref:hypothetical protein n=1 Tax=Haloarchaeobius sp. HME9146 TaxID=2978732 RepID=UPI0021BF42BD|nr:hypothetical protein [Haloarchaeobius sp. HME9146]MCT9097954.1 hypothetical protein [Haloarchaeobius sp. HME9146]
MRLSRQSAGVLGVGAVSATAVFTAELPLYTVIVLLWIDLTVSLLRRTWQLFFARPRDRVSPTGAGTAPEGGHSTLSKYEQGLCRFFTPKIGSLVVSERLRPVTLHNVRPALNVTLLWSFLFLPVAALGVSQYVVPSPVFDEFVSWPVPALLVAGALAAVVKQWGILVRHETTGWPTADAVAPGWGLALWSLYWVPLGILTTLHSTGPAVDTLLTTLAVVLVLTGTIRGLRATDVDGDDVSHRARRRGVETQTGPTSVEMPNTRPVATFRPNRRAVWMAGALDSLFPVGNASGSFRRLQLQAGVAVVLLVGAPLIATSVYDIDSGLVLVAVTALMFVTYLFTLAIIGALHFELAFGSVEYRLSDEALVAYDSRLDAVQWSVSREAIRDGTVEDGVFDSPPTFDAATVTLDRTDEVALAEPYRYYRCSLPYLDDPVEAVDRLGSEVEPSPGGGPVDNRPTHP